MSHEPAVAILDDGREKGGATLISMDPEPKEAEPKTTKETKKQKRHLLDNLDHDSTPSYNDSFSSPLTVDTDAAGDGGDGDGDEVAEDESSTTTTKNKNKQPYRFTLRSAQQFAAHAAAEAAATVSDAADIDAEAAGAAAQAETANDAVDLSASSTAPAKNSHLLRGAVKETKGEKKSEGKEEEVEENRQLLFGGSIFGNDKAPKKDPWRQKREAEAAKQAKKQSPTTVTTTTTTTTVVQKTFQSNSKGAKGLSKDGDRDFYGDFEGVRPV